MVEKTLSTSILEKLSDTVTVALQSSFPTVNITALQEKLRSIETMEAQAGSAPTVRPQEQQS